MAVLMSVIEERRQVHAGNIASIQVAKAFAHVPPSERVKAAEEMIAPLSRHEQRAFAQELFERVCNGA